VAIQAQVLGPGEVQQVEVEGNLVRVKIATQAGPVLVFEGREATEGEDAGKYLGIFDLRGRAFPARMESTTSKTLAQFGRGTLNARFGELRREEPAKRLEALRVMLEEFKGPVRAQILAAMVRTGVEIKAEAAVLDGFVQQWLESARPYGPVWLQTCRLNAARELRGAAAYAKTAHALAKDAAQELAADSADELREDVYGILADTAKAVGDAEGVAAADAQLLEVSARLDAAHAKAVPPFEPKRYGGRSKKDAGRVVLMELFTGAQCPPCVAADVGFDGLIASYEPTELITLQYHLHIPGPDPMTTADSESRAKYYGVGGTPSTYFNGAENGGGGGPMTASESKYNEFRKLIDPELELAAGAAIELKATRKGNLLTIRAAADATNGQAAAAGPKPEGEAASAAAGKLRIVLTEHVVRYRGGNGLRLHHHVVRGLLNGAEGTEVVDGKAIFEGEIDLDALRAQQEKYVADFAATKAPFAGRTSAPELRDISVVAFVQQEDTKRVLHAVSVHVAE
jgi:hypothetical protein